MSVTNLNAPPHKLTLTVISAVVGLHVLTALALVMVQTPTPTLIEEPLTPAPPIEIQLLTLPTETLQSVNDISDDSSKPAQNVASDSVAHKQDPEEAEAKIEPETQVEPAVKEEIVTESAIKETRTDEPKSQEDAQEVQEQAKIEAIIQEQPKVEPQIREVKERKQAPEMKGEPAPFEHYVKQKIEPEVNPAAQQPPKPVIASKMPAESAVSSTTQTTITAATPSQSTQDPATDAKPRDDRSTSAASTNPSGSDSISDEPVRLPKDQNRSNKPVTSGTKAADNTPPPKEPAAKVVETVNNEPASFTANNASWASRPNFSFPDNVRGIKSGDTFTVVLLFRVNKQGVIEDVSLSKSSGHSVIDKAALKQARGGKFKPFTKDGVPRVGNVIFPIDYYVP